MRKVLPIILLMFSFLVLVSGCGKTIDPSAKVVEDYLTALVNKDSNALSTLSCADWESNAKLELDSLQMVKTSLQGLTCNVTGSEGVNTLVNCQGKIIASYNGEDQVLDLSVRTYQVVKQGGVYLVCGYK